MEQQQVDTKFQEDVLPLRFFTKEFNNKCVYDHPKKGFSG